MNKAYFEVQSIIDSIRFYTMLGIVCRQNENFSQDSDFQLKRFLSELKEDKQYSEEKINKYCKVAVETLPSEFLSIFNIDRINRR